MQLCCHILIARADPSENKVQNAWSFGNVFYGSSVFQGLVTIALAR